MIPATYDISAYQGDALMLDIPLQRAGPTPGSRVPLSVADAAHLRDTYPLIRMQVRVDRAGPVLVSASKAAGELYIDPNSVLPDGTPQPVFSVRIAGSKLEVLIDARYDIEFDYPGSLGPLTPLAGAFSLNEEISHDDGT